MIYETIISPGEGIGNLVKLGESMFNTIKHLNKFDYKLKVSYSDTDFLNVPIVVTIVEYGIRLTFRNRQDQSLDLIELNHLNEPNFGATGSNGQKYNAKLIKLIYKGISLNEFESLDVSAANHFEEDSGHPSSEHVSSSNSSATLTEGRGSVTSTKITLRSIYNTIFGPTYPGRMSANGPFYVLSYPGVSFKFTISNDRLYSKLVEPNPKDPEHILSTLLNWDSPEDIVCESIALFKGHSWDEFNFESKVNAVNEASEISQLNINLEAGSIEVVKSKEIGSAGAAGASPILKIGHTTQQEVLSILGPPDDYFNKSDSRLLIHTQLPGAKLGAEERYSEVGQHKFHNYFRYGIDILYEFDNLQTSRNQSSTRIKKIVIHDGGMCESMNFMKWNRCNWEISGMVNNKKITINSSMYFKDFPAEIKSLTPVLLNRDESQIVDTDLDFIDLPPATGVTELNSPQKLKPWIQSKLYGFDRCIFEVGDSNDCVSSVTLY